MNITFDYIEPVRRARRSDPVTSKQAATRATEFATNHYGRILAALDRITNATPVDIGELAGLTVVQVDRRMHELESAGRVACLRDDKGEPVTRDGFRVWSRTA